MDLRLTVLITLVVAAAVGLLFFLIWFFGEYLPVRRFNPLKRRFGFVPAPGKSDRLLGEWDGRKAQIEYHPATKRQRGEPRLSVWLLHSGGPVPDIVFRRESLFYRLMKGIGISREAESRDPLFDSKVYAESIDDAALSPFLAADELRAGVLALLAIPRTTVRVQEDSVGVVVRGHFGWSRYFEPEKIQELLHHLGAIAASVERAPRPTGQSVEQLARLDLFEGSTFAERMGLLRHPARMAIFLSCLSAFVGLVMFAWGTRYQPVTWRLHFYATILSTVSLLICLPLFLSFTRGRSRSHHFFFTFLFAAMVGFPTFWVGSLKVANALADRQEPVMLEAQILRFSAKESSVEAAISLGDRIGKVWVKAQPPRPGKLRRGEIFPLIVSPGALGEPWIVGPAHRAG